MRLLSHWQRTARLLLLLSLAVQLAPAYYFFFHVRSGENGLRMIPEKFDLGQLPTRSVPYLFSSSKPEKLAGNDSIASILSQIDAAAAAWNSVDTSSLRLHFGGFAATAAMGSKPGIDVVFDELPPGLIALAGPTVRSESNSTAAGDFVPIQRSVLILPKDLSQQKTCGELFFLTLVHELGHAVGLQHTMTSSVMSTGVTRGATRALPLAGDDRAAVSVLYPAPGSQSRFGRVSGSVTMQGKPVHLASVVALTAGGQAISAVTDPAGRYLIDGLPPGNYFLFAHPYPPSFQAGLGPGDVVLPVDRNGEKVPATGFFAARFYPNATDWREAQLLPVDAGQSLDQRNFEVRPREGLNLYDVTTYSFPGNVAVHPAFIDVNRKNSFLVASGVGLLQNERPASGLNLQVVGGAAYVPSESVITYPWASAFLQANLEFALSPALGPKHLVFLKGGDPYLLPSAFYLVRSQPPSISEVERVVLESGREAVRVKGTGFALDTRFYFDGLPARVLSRPDPFLAEGPVTLLPPPGPSGHNARIAALNSDGQSSLFLTEAPPVYEYPDAPLGGPLELYPSALEAGAERFIELRSPGARWEQGRTRLAFGSTDVAVRDLWVLEPGRLFANVSVAPSAARAVLNITVTTGLDVATEEARLEILPASPGRLAVSPVPWNPATSFPSVFPGGEARFTFLPHGHLPDESPVTATLNGLAVEQARIEGGSLRFRVPANLPPRLVVFEVHSGSRRGGPLLLEIDPVPPAILSASVTTAAHPLGAGAAQPQRVRVSISGFDSGSGPVAVGRFGARIAGSPAAVLSAEASAEQPGVVALEVSLPEGPYQESPIPLVVWIDGRPGLPFALTVPVTDSEP